MEPLEILVPERRGFARQSYLVEQGVPVRPMSGDEVDRLAVFDSEARPVAASIEPEGFDHNGAVKWLLVSFPVDVEANGEARFELREGQSAIQPLVVTSRGDKVTAANRFFTVEFAAPGGIRLTTNRGVLLEGQVGVDIRSDARSTVGGLRPLHFEPQGYEVLSQTLHRIKVLLRGKYRAWAPKSYDIDTRRGYDVEVEFVVHSSSPVIRLRWRITNLMRFNCSYMWLDRYVLTLPLAEDCVQAASESGRLEGNLGSWVLARTGGGELACVFPFTDWIGRGAGVELVDEHVGLGGIDPPADGGFGGKCPDIWRKFFYGMSRSFEGSLLVDPTPEQVAAELNPIPMVLPAQHYSDTGALPENGGRVTFGEWRDTVDRACEHLLDTQWRGTLWFGEWWRERDIDHDLGIEETHSGNSSFAPLHHFYRTGDWRCWESAKMSFYYTYDVQFCKQEDGYGPYMHTRRFVLDHQEWFHPRYQRVGGIIEPSHLFGDGQARAKTLWLVRYWAERYVGDDGSPLEPRPDGGTNKCTESAMSNLIDSFMHGYIETGDGMFLEVARRMADWVVRGAEADIDTFAGNSNSTRYILRGLLPLCRITRDQRYIDTFVALARWTVNSPIFDHGTHYTAFHFNFASEAFKMSGARDILDGITRLAQWVVGQESKEQPGTYPFPNRYQYPTTNWICIYDNQAIVSFLPVLASTLEQAAAGS